MAEVSTRSLARNSAFALIAQMWRIGSRLIITPLIITQIGLEGYGTWTLIFVICAYVSIVDVNFGVAYSKYTAEFDARRDYARLTEIIGSGMALVGAIAAVGILILWLLRLPILRLLGVPQELLEPAGYALLIVSLSLPMKMSIGCVFPILTGLQRLDLNHKLDIFASAVEFAVSIFLLYRGWGLLALATGHLVGQVMATATGWRWCRRLCPDLRISPFRCSRYGLKKITSLGGKFQFLSVLYLLIHQGTKMLISALLGTRMLAIADIATKLISLGVAAGGAVIAPIMPALSNLYAAREMDRARLLFERASRMVAVVCIPSFAFLAIFADRLVFLWTGEVLPLSAWTVRWIAPVALLAMLTGISTAALRARGSIRMELAYALVGVFLLAIFYPPGYMLWGFKGMVRAEVIAGIGSAAWFLSAYARKEGFSVMRYLYGSLWRPLAIFAPLLVGTILLLPWLHIEVTSVRPRVSTLIDVGVWWLLFTLVAASLGWFMVLSAPERAALLRMFSRKEASNEQLVPLAAVLETPPVTGAEEPVGRIR